MTMVVPSAPPSPRASPGSSDGAHARRNAGDSDFAAALSETAGDVADDAPGGGDPTTNVREITRQPTKSVHRLDARERRAMAAGDKAEGETLADPLAELTDGKLAGPREVIAQLVAERAVSPETAGAAPANEKVDIAPVPQPMPQRGDAARDALAVLGVDMTAKRDTSTPSAELMTQSRRQVSVGGKQPDTVVGNWEMLEANGLPGETPDIGEIPVRVLRQETHFQPIAHEARRLLGMTAGAPDDRVLPLSLAAAAKISRPQVLQQLSGDTAKGADAVADAGALAPSSSVLSAATTDGATPVGIGQQIADGVQRAMASSGESAAPRSVPGADPNAPVFAPTLRTIKLQLNPHALGMVTVVLTGGDGDLRIHLETERAETFGKVEQERGVLSARLNGAGYGITEVTVARAATADTQTRDGDQREAAARQGNASGGPNGDTAGGHARQSAEQFADQRSRRDSAAHAPGVGMAAAARSGAIDQPVAGVSYSGRFRPV
jgi:hypothetical protein